MKIQWIHGAQHGVVEDVERPAAEQAIAFGSAVPWGNDPLPSDIAPLAPGGDTATTEAEAAPATAPEPVAEPAAEPVAEMAPEA